MVSFDAVVENNKVLTTWVTASERNNEFFTVERSADAFHFEPIGVVPGAGNSDLLLKYSLVDVYPLNGLSYYRLKQTDFDGRSEYSQVVKVSFDRAEMKVYPNPSKGIFTIEITEAANKQATVKIFDSNTRMVYHQRLSVDSNWHELSIDLTGYPPGHYSILTSIGDTSLKRFVIIQ